MAPSASADSAVKWEKGRMSLDQLHVGLKAWVEKEGEKRKAEILAIKPKAGRQIFYVHYEDFNKRLDEWVPEDRIDLTKEVEWPVQVAPEKDAKKSDQKKDKAPTKAPLKSSNQAKASKAPRAGGKENRESINVITTEVATDGTPQPDDDAVIDVATIQDNAAAAKAAAPEIYSREEEIEKLRQGGSMTQNQTEINRVRNLERVDIGGYSVEPWYFSPYPKEVTDSDPLYIDEFCLSHFASLKQFKRHRSKCTVFHPPGNEIYRDDKISFFEIDGSRQITWCRNLCLLSKLFLDHKTLYYDVDPFLFYCMCTRDEHGYHLVGYFSKEKQSADGYNVACILTLPQHQRKGYGRLLINFSYELSKREQKNGSPEKPLSDLGLLGYRAYWQEVVVESLLATKSASVEELATQNAMTVDDVVHTLQNLNMLRFKENNHVIVLTDAVLAAHERARKKAEKLGGRHVIDAEKLQETNWMMQHRINIDYAYSRKLKKEARAGGWTREIVVMREDEWEAWKKGGGSEDGYTVKAKDTEKDKDTEKHKGPEQDTETEKDKGRSTIRARTRG